MNIVKGMTNMSWSQIKDIALDRKFLRGIKTISNKKLRKRFLEFGVDALNDEVEEFKTCVIKIITRRDEFCNANKNNKKILDDKDLSDTAGGGIVGFIAGCAAKSQLCGDSESVIVKKFDSESKELERKYNNLKNRLIRGKDNLNNT